ncbi:MAG: dephospho-CoA kinase [Chloroflexi bacterium]|nr:MAG: dephospho-CoA kinase [Chloroflexota bacterium]
MRLIGLTGGIATGKSTVAEMLGSRGALVVDADRLAREVVEPGTPALTAIVAEFGEGVLDAEGRLDRGVLGGVVFADPERRRRLEDITHPAIGTLMQERVAAAVLASPPLVAVDIPLLFETHRQGMFEGVLLVYADESTQLRRLAARDGLTESEARRRLSAQMPIDEKRRLATWVIDNSRDVAETEHQVQRWWTEVMA